MTAAERLKQYEDLFAQSQAYNPATFQSDFEKAYGEATNYNKDLYDSRAQAIGQAQALPNQLREQYYSSAIRNPLAQESLISTRRGNITSDIQSLTDFLGARGARYQDVLAKHLAAYQTSADQARMAAENAWRMYQDAAAREEAERQRRAAAAAAAAQQRSLASLFNQGGVGTQGEQGGTPEDITINRGANWSDILFGTDLTTVRPTSYSDAVKKAVIAGINPLTLVKSAAGALGNWWGNQMVPKRQNMTLLDKLLNR